MRILFFLIFTTLLSGCTTVEIAKEVTKATKSIKTSVDIMINSMENDREVLKKEKKEKEKIVLEQKKIVKINFIEKTFDQIKINLGEPNLSRIDGNTFIARFDNNSCRLFLFFNNNDKIKKIKHYELRDVDGVLVINKNKIQNCYKKYNLI